MSGGRSRVDSALRLRSSCQHTAFGAGRLAGVRAGVRGLTAAAAVVLTLGSGASGYASPDAGSSADGPPVNGQAPARGDQRSFFMTEEIWHCVKTRSGAEHGTVFEPPDADQGRATTKKWVGLFLLDFSFDEKAQMITYNIVEKPRVVWNGAIWNGIMDTIERCR